MFEVKTVLERFFAEEKLGMVNKQNVKKLLGTGEILWGYYMWETTREKNDTEGKKLLEENKSEINTSKEVKYSREEKNN